MVEGVDGDVEGVCGVESAGVCDEGVEVESVGVCDGGGAGDVAVGGSGVLGVGCDEGCCAGGVSGVDCVCGVG